MSEPLSPPIPMAGTCLNGGTLGTGSDLRLMLTTRGATRLITELKPVAGQFTRELHATSTCTAEAVIGGRPDAPDHQGWSKAVPWATEFLVLRDGRDAWCGPVTEPLYGVGTASVQAADLTAWWDRRRTVAATYTDMDPVAIFVALHEAAMGVDPVPNFLVSEVPTSILTSRTYVASDESYVSDDLHELGDTFVDWTMFSRTLKVSGSEIAPDAFLMLTDEMWSTPPSVKIRGNEQATRVIVKGADGLVGIATSSQEYLDYYGLLERVFEESTLTDQASLDANAATRLATLQDPLYIEPPSGATLLSSAPIRFENLIPGLRVRVHATATCREVIGDFRLSKVTANFDGKVSVDLQPLGSVS